MEQVAGEITLAEGDPGVNEIIGIAPPDPIVPTKHYDENEDFFLRIADPVTVPHLPIHHDVKTIRPEEAYLESLRELMRILISRRVAVFHGLSYVFDPTEVQRPTFYTVLEHDDGRFLFLLRLDLSFRPNTHEVVENGSNDVSPRYSTDRLYMEADIMPLDAVVEKSGGMKAFNVEQVISQTWIGETGRGYFVQGIWLDRDLTKFFSKLFLPPKKRTYPYYPLTCKYRSICYTALELTSDRRGRETALLAAARSFIKPHVEEIQDALKEDSFDESLPAFRRLKEQVDERWYDHFEKLRVRPYLNEADMKEFVVATD